ncbi:hypothetical protein BR10RB9215_C20638 [Brucella sp. 10RB9215]|nr:hypothetical protein BR10RB9215_C20638 [Brucella sp. 10RB9215]
MRFELVSEFDRYSNNVPCSNSLMFAHFEAPRVYRRFHLLSRMKHHEQDDEQVSPEVGERAMRLVFDNEGQQGSCWHGIMSIVAKISGSAIP